MTAEPPPYRRCYLVTNEYADTHGHIGVLVNVLDMQDDPDLRERRLVLRFGEGPDCAMHRDELEEIYV